MKLVNDKNTKAGIGPQELAPPTPVSEMPLISQEFALLQLRESEPLPLHKLEPRHLKPKFASKNYFSPIFEGENDLEDDYIDDEVDSWKLVSPSLHRSKKSKPNTPAPLEVVDFPCEEIDEVLYDDIPDNHIFCPPLYSLYDTYSHKKYELNLFRNVLYVINRDNKKVVWICCPDELFWTDHATIPRTETVEYAIERILQQCFISPSYSKPYTKYRKYSVVNGYKVTPVNTGKNKSKQPHGSYTPHSGTFDVKADIRAMCKSMPMADMATAIADAMSSHVASPCTYDMAVTMLRIIAHSGAIFTSQPGANRMWCIGSALLDLVADTSTRNLIFTCMSNTTVFTAQAGELDSLQDIAMTMRGPLFTHLDTLICLLVSAGFVAEDKLSIAGINMFATGFAKNASSRDIGARVLEAIHYLGSVGYDCFTTRSFEPISCMKDDLMYYSKNVAELVHNLPSVIQGNYQTLYGKDESHFEDLLTNTLSQSLKIEKLYSTAPPPVLTYVRTLSAKLNNVKVDFHMDKMSRGSRIRPLCLKFWGDTGVGKSYINQMTILEVLKSNNFPSSQDNICTMTDEKFDSTMKSNSTGIIIDDMCNTRPEQDEFNPAAKLIRVINNICAPAIKADVQDKGKVLIMPKVVGITTNCRGLAADYWSINEGSILRRCDIHIDTYIRPEFAKDTGILDSSMVQRHFTDEEVHDIYLLRVNYYDHVKKSLVPYIYNDSSGRYPELHGKPMVGVSIFVFWEWLYEFSNNHFMEQTRLQNTMISSYSAFRCTNCNRHINTCSCIALTRKFPHCEEIPVYNETQMLQQKLPVRRLDFKKQYSVDKSVRGIDPDTHKDKILEPPGSKPQYKPHAGIAGTMVYGLLTPLRKQVAGSIFDAVSSFMNQMCPTFLEKSIVDTSLGFNPFEYIVDYHDKWYSWNNLLPTSFTRGLASTYLGQQFIKASIRKSTYRQLQLTCVGSALAILPCMFYYRKSLPRGSYPVGFATIGALSITSAHLQYNYLSARFTYQALPQHKFEAQAEKAFKLSKYDEMECAYIFKWALNAITIASLASVALAVYTSYNAVPCESHSLSPANEEEFNSRNKSWNFWTMPFMRTTVAPSPKTTIHLENTISKNLVHISFDHGEGTKVSCCNAIWLRTDELMLPKHIFHPNFDVFLPIKESIRFKLTKSAVIDPKNPQCGSKYVNWKVAPSCDIRELCPDWAVLKTYSLSGSMRDLTRPDGSGNYYFSKKDDLISRKLVSTLYRTQLGTIDKGTAQVAEFGIVNIQTEVAKGIFPMYSATMTPTEREWKGGDCGTVLIDRATKCPTIVGFHLYGKTSSSVSTGISYAITLEDIQKFVSSDPDSYKAHCICDVPVEINGLHLDISQEQPLHSPAKYVKGNYDVLGYIKGCNHYSTNLKKTQLYDKVSTKFSLEYSPPDFKNFKPFDDFLHDCSNHNNYLSHSLLKRCREDYLSDLKRCADSAQYMKQYIKPLTNSQIINGIPGIKFLDRMKNTSAMGFPYKGKRSTYLRIVSEDAEGCVMDWKDSSIWTEFERLHDVYRSGDTIAHPFKSSLKDEIRSNKKLKPRVFQAAPLFLQLFIRKYFLPLAVFLSNFPISSECAVGINPMSTEWDEMMGYVESFGSDTLFAGDYSKWDTTYEKELAHSTYWVLIEIARWFGYSEDDILIMQGISTDLMNVVLLIFGTLVRVVGPNASGQNMTTYVNSIGNSLKARYVAFEIDPSIRDFRSECHIATYGDDIIAGCKPSSKINFNSYRDCLARYDINFTLPTKESADSFPNYLPRDKMDFLKRKSVFIPQLGRSVGALDTNSIWKSLLYYNSSSSQTECSILKSTIESATFELAAHGEEYYNEYLPFLVELAKDMGISTPMLRTNFDDKIKLFSKAQILDDDDYSTPVGASSAGTLITFTLGLLQGYAQQQGSSFIPDEDAIRYNTLNIIKSDDTTLNESERPVDSGTKGDTTPINEYKPHAETISTGDAPAQTTAISNFSMGDDGEAIQENQTQDPTKDIGVTPDVPISDWFARPVLVSTNTWSPSGSITTSFDPISSYFGNAEVSTKLRKFTYITGKVHVKAVITGTAFHFGKMIMAYEPYGVVGRGPHFTQLTCLPHICISPGDDAGGTISFDIMHQYNSIDITAYGYAPNVVSRIWLDTINPLRVLGSTTLPCTLLVYVWMTDVKLRMATSAIPDGTITFQAQAGENEMKSKDAPSTLFMSRIYNLPVLGRYIKASMVALQAGSDIATLFGYSKPCVYHDDVRAIPTFTGNWANFNAVDSSNKLSLDQKAEVFVDNVITGSPDMNEMDLTAIAKRECLIAPLAVIANQSTSVCFFKMNITPCVSVNTGGYTILTPMAHVASAFRQWRGTMKIRVEIVATPFHRGKVRVLYDPVKDINGVTLPEINTFYSHLIDLSEAREYTFCIGWGRNKNFLYTNDPTVNNIGTTTLAVDKNTHNGQLSIILESPITASLTTAASTQIYVNVYASMCDDFEVGQPWGGYFADKELYITPDATRPALLGPLPNEGVGSKLVSPDVSFSPHAVTMELDRERRDQSTDLCLNMVPEHVDGGELTGIHFGEKIKSLRQILKRYSFVDVFMATASANQPEDVLLNTLISPTLPLFRRYTTVTPYVPIAGVTPGGYRITRNTFMNWFLPAYVGFRGGYRWKYVIVDNDQARTVYSEASIPVRSASSTSPWSQSVATVFGASSSPDLQKWTANNLATTSENGQTINIPYHNPVIQMEIPYYAPERFKTVRSLEFSDPTLDMGSRSGYQMYSLYNYGSNQETARYIPVYRYFAAADDFSLVYYKYGPILYVRNTPTPV